MSVGQRASFVKAVTPNLEKEIMMLFFLIFQASEFCQ